MPRVLVVASSRAPATTVSGAPPPLGPWAVLRRLSRFRVQPTGTNATATVTTNGAHFRRLVRCGLSAARTLVSLLLNAAISVAFAWTAALCISRGDVLHVPPRPPAAQSATAFGLATLLWVHAWFGLSLGIVRATSFAHLEFLSHPGRPAGLALALRVLLWRTSPGLVITGAAVALVGLAAGRYVPRESPWRQYRPEMYASAACNYAFVAVVAHAARGIYRHGTVEGRAVTTPRDRPQVATRATTTARATTTTNGRRRWRRLLRAALSNSSILVSLLVPTIYVHVISAIGPITTSAIVGFAAVSILLKLAMQELAKIYILRRKIHDTRSMALLVCVPTVIVDTQVRVVLMRLQSTQVTISGTLGLAGIEIGMRVTKALMLRWQIQRRRRRERRSVQSLQVSERDLIESRTGTGTRVVEFEIWKRRLQRYHITELVADMYAEYIAIGCSYAIIYFFWSHPHYRFRAVVPAPGTTTTDASDRTATSAFALGVQLLVEIVVDFVSCTFEIAQGLNFGIFEHQRGFFVAFFITLTIVNINVSALLYQK